MKAQGITMTILDELCAVLDADHAQAVIDHRRVTIKKPLTVLAARMLAKRFAEWGNANQAAEIMIERVWQGFQAAWVCGPKQFGRRTYVDVAMERFNGSESVFGGDGTAKLISADRQSGSDDEDLRSGAGVRFN